MDFSRFITVYAVSVPIFFAIDMLWLGFIATSFYKSQLGELLSPKVNWPVAVAFYLIFLVGLAIFATLPAQETRSLSKALLYGALFGFFTYATYDLTNWATIRNWPGLLSLVDIAWGTLLSALVSGLTYWVVASFFK